MFGKHGDAPTVGRLGELAEGSSWDGIFLEDYVCFEDEQGHPFKTFDPWVELAVIAMRTGHVRIGTELTPLSRRRPWKLARETVTLDHLSNGRLTLTVGLGGFIDEMNDKGFTHFGEATDAKTRARECWTRASTGNIGLGKIPGCRLSRALEVGHCCCMMLQCLWILARRG